MPNTFYEDVIGNIEGLGIKYGWTLLAIQEENKLISFYKGDKENGDWVRINIYYTTMTVGTCLQESYKGITQSFRRGVSPEELEEIFKKPREQEDKGYYTHKK